MSEITSSNGILKHDEQKVMLDLVEPWVEEQLALVYMAGLKKYRRDSWKEFSVGDARKLIAPAKRHINQYRKGEFFDPDDGCPNLVKAAWNLLTIYWHEQEELNRNGGCNGNFNCTCGNNHLAGCNSG